MEKTLIDVVTQLSPTAQIIAVLAISLGPPGALLVIVLWVLRPMIKTMTDTGRALAEVPKRVEVQQMFQSCHESCEDDTKQEAQITRLHLRTDDVIAGLDRLTEATYESIRVQSKSPNKIAVVVGRAIHDKVFWRRLADREDEEGDSDEPGMVTVGGHNPT